MANAHAGIPPSGELMSRVWSRWPWTAKSCVTRFFKRLPLCHVAGTGICMYNTYIYIYIYIYLYNIFCTCIYHHICIYIYVYIYTCVCMYVCIWDRAGFQATFAPSAAKSQAGSITMTISPQSRCDPSIGSSYKQTPTCMSALCSIPTHLNHL